MKLASIKNGRDGRLIVVSRDLATATFADYVAPTLQAALDNWTTTEPQLKALYDKLNAGHRSLITFEFNQAACASPLPRAYTWMDGSCLLYTSPSPRDQRGSRMPSSA